MAETDEFAQLFRAFLTRFVDTATPPPGELHEHLREFFGCSPLTLPVMTRSFPSYQLADLHLGLQAVLASHTVAATVGIGGLGREYRTLTEMVAESTFRIAAVDYRAVTVGPGAELSCVSFGMFLVRLDGAGPAAVLLRADDPDNARGEVKLEVMTPAGLTSVAEEFIARIEQAARERSVLRGQVVSIAPSEFADGMGPLRFHQRPSVGADDIVMPVGLLAAVERQVAGIARHAGQLRRLHQHLRRGVLLYGPPGTGKTLTIRYLISGLPEFTAVLVTGTAIRHIAAACAIARACQPAMVVVEDVDLIAEDRALTESPAPLLMTLLNELDGIGDDADIAFVLTTNRVDVLERALVERPGRVDLAVEIPLPDADARRHLFTLYTRDISGLSTPVLDEVAVATEGVTASFVKEAVRRAVLTAAERGGDHQTSSNPTDDDLKGAVAEMLDVRASLTGRLLGARAEHSDTRRPAVFDESC